MADPFQDTPPAFEGEEDPAAEFLAREQDELAGIDDGEGFTFNGAESNDASNSNPYDAFGDANDVQPSDPTMDDFEMSNGDAVMSEEPVDNMNSGDTGYAAISQMDRLAIEPEKIKIWREEQRVMLEEKDAAEEKQINELMEVAKKELEDWYKHRNEQLEKTMATNRDAEEAYVKEIEDKEPGSEFERICKLCDFNRRTLRILEMFLDLDRFYCSLNRVA